MQIEYRLSLKDFQEANQAHFKLQSWVYWAFWIFLLIGILLQIVYLFSGQPIDLFLIVYLFIFPILFCNPYFSNPLKNYFIKRAWKDLSNMHHPLTVEVNEEGMKMKSPVFDSSVQWQLYIKAVETKNLFMLYQAKRLFNMIPKRAFRASRRVPRVSSYKNRKVY